MLAKSVRKYIRVTDDFDCLCLGPAGWRRRGARGVGRGYSEAAAGWQAFSLSTCYILWPCRATARECVCVYATCVRSVGLSMCVCLCVCVCHNVQFKCKQFAPMRQWQRRSIKSETGQRQLNKIFKRQQRLRLPWQTRWGRGVAHEDTHTPQPSGGGRRGSCE